MLNREAAAAAAQQLSEAIERYDELYATVRDVTDSIYELRTRIPAVVLRRAKISVRRVVDRPLDVDNVFFKFETEYIKFCERESQIAIQLEKASANRTAGEVAGTTVPRTAALAAATTFGVTSTGAAISVLSAAATTNAALGRVCGNAFKVEEGAVAARALLALAGPVGRAIARVAVVGEGDYSADMNSLVHQSAHHKLQHVERGRQLCESSIEMIGALFERTNAHAQGLGKLLDDFETILPANYGELTTQQVNTMEGLVHHVRALSHLQNMTLESCQQ